MINSRGSSQVLSSGIFNCINVFGQKNGVKCFIDWSKCLLLRVWGSKMNLSLLLKIFDFLCPEQITILNIVKFHRNNGIK